MLARFMGRKMIVQMTFFDFVVGVTVGTVTANMALGSNSTPLSAAAVLLVLAVLTVAVDYTHIKSFIFTKIVDSEPVILIEEGKMMYDNMRRVRLPVLELLTLLREKNIFNLSDVDYAIMEIDGKLSVLPKPERKPLTPADMGINPVYRGIDKQLVVDGNIMEENLIAAGWKKEELLTRLKGHGVTDIGDVLYAGVDSVNNFYISLKQAGGESHGKHGID